MTISSRNRMFFSGTVILIAGLIVLSLVSLRLFMLPNDTSAFQILPDEFGTVHGPSFGFTPYMASWLRISLQASGALLVFGAITILFRKTSSPEIFFFAVWAFSPSFELVRIAIPATAGFGGIPLPLAVIATRTAIFGRLLGAFSLFAAGVYATGLNYEKLGRFLGIIAIVALAGSGAIPVNSSNPSITFGFTMGYLPVFLGVLLTIELTTALNFLIASRINQARDFAWMAISVLACASGRELMYWSVDPALLIPGFILFVSGSIVFMRVTHSYYLWS